MKSPFLLVACALLAGLSCSGDPVRMLAEDPFTMAIVGRYSVTAEDFRLSQEYARPSKEAGDSVRSRLWDLLVEEVLVLNDLAATAPPPVPIPLGPYADPVLRADTVRHALESKVYSQATVSDQEVKRYYQEHAAEYARGRGLLVRQMLLSGRAQAEEAARLLGSGHSFSDVARLYSGSPERGGSEYFAQEEIPEFLLPTLSTLPAGKPSAPIEVAPDSFQIILVERRLDSFTLPLHEVAPLIRLKLTDEAQAALASRYLATLRERFPVRVFQNKFPFRYEKENP